MKPGITSTGIVIVCLGFLWGCSSHRLNWDPNDYTVKSGDTLYSIAWRYELDPIELARWNGLSSPYVIRPGDRLHTRESGRVKTTANTTRPLPQVAADRQAIRVEKGDTLYSLARQHGMPVWKLASINGLKQPYIIHPGQELRLQSSTTAVAKSPTRPVPPDDADAILDKNSKLSWQWPIKGNLLGRFNRRKNDAKGIDIAGVEGRPIRAAAPGKVVYSGNGLISYGNLVIIKHNRSYLSAYAHNRKLLVEEGQMVKPGQTIAELGTTGTDSPRLHFEIRKNGKPVDPLLYLPSS